MDRNRKNIIKNKESSDYVRYSRAGDAFHYRWAARRCLRMINPRFPERIRELKTWISDESGPEATIEAILPLIAYFYPDATYKYSWPFALYLKLTGDETLVRERFGKIRQAMRVI